MQESPSNVPSQLPVTPLSARHEDANSSRSGVGQSRDRESQSSPGRREHPLTPEAKLSVLRNLPELATEDDLLKALISAALAGHQFPDIIADRLSPLQVAYQKNHDLESVRTALEASIRIFIKDVGITMIKSLLQQTIMVEQWQSSLVYQLASASKTTLDTYYLVEGIVINAKIYWRIVDNAHQVVYDRAKERGKNVIFDSDQSWFMSWQQFWAFKSSGKRHSNVKISKKHFISKFSPAAAEQAGLIWEELRAKNIITEKLKLSYSWRLQSGCHIQLDAIKHGPITHNDVANVLNTLTCVEQYRELFPVPHLIKVKRHDRSPKSWSGTSGWIEYQSPRAVEYCNKLWDVSVYVELNAHRNTAEEEKLFGEKLNYDHSPSVTECKQFAQHCILSFSEQIRQDQDTLKLLAAQAEASSQHQPDGVSTRAELRATTSASPRAALLQSQIDKVRENIALHEGAISLFRAECQSAQGGFWWAIAIPEKLHFQGKTFLKKVTFSADQCPLLRDVSCYIDILEVRPEEFRLSKADVLYALGAFRFLYRVEATAFESIPNTHKHVGYAPNGMLNNPASFKALDTFFNQRIRKCLSQQEGLNSEQTLAPRKINF